MKCCGASYRRQWVSTHHDGPFHFWFWSSKKMFWLSQLEKNWNVDSQKFHACQIARRLIARLPDMLSKHHKICHSWMLLDVADSYWVRFVLLTSIVSTQMTVIGFVTMFLNRPISSPSLNLFSLYVTFQIVHSEYFSKVLVKHSAYVGFDTLLCCCVR